MAGKHSLPSIKSIVINGRNDLSLLVPTAPALLVECLLGDDKMHELSRCLTHFQYSSRLQRNW